MGTLLLLLVSKSFSSFQFKDLFIINKIVHNYSHIEKIGKFSPGMHIPIVNMEHFHKNPTDAIYLFGWNHKEEILKKEKNFNGEWFSHVEL